MMWLSGLVAQVRSVRTRSTAPLEVSVVHSAQWRQNIDTHIHFRKKKKRLGMLLHLFNGEEKNVFVLASLQP